MAAGTWKIYAKAKKYIGAGTIILGATNIYKMQLYRSGASATPAGAQGAIQALSVRSTNGSLSAHEISATGGYVAGGRTMTPSPGLLWTVGTSAKQYKFTMTASGLGFTASGASLKVIKYALIRNSTSAAGGKALCFCTLSSTAFSITSPNTLNAEIGRAHV